MPRNNSYIEVHQTSLQTIAESIDERIDNSVFATIIQSSGRSTTDSEPTIIYANAEPIDREVAENAEVDTNSLWLSSTIQRDRKVSLVNERNSLGLSGAIHLPPLEYVSSLYKFARFTNANENVDLAHARLEGLELFNQADLLWVSVSDGLIYKRFNMILLDNTLSSVRQAMRPVKDVITRQARYLIDSEALNELNMIRKREMSDEELLDELINLRLKFVGDPNERQIDRIFNLVRREKRSLQELADLELQMSVPSAADIEEFLLLIQGL